MVYSVTLLDFAEKDFEKLDGSIQIRANRQLEKLREAPELGDDLGSKFGVDLTGCKALHFYKNQYRIVYRIFEDKKEVEVWGIGKRVCVCLRGVQPLNPESKFFLFNTKGLKSLFP